MMGSFASNRDKLACAAIERWKIAIDHEVAKLAFYGSDPSANADWKPPRALGSDHIFILAFAQESHPKLDVSSLEWIREFLVRWYEHRDRLTTAQISEFGHAAAAAMVALAVVMIGIDARAAHSRSSAAESQQAATGRPNDPTDRTHWYAHSWYEDRKVKTTAETMRRALSKKLIRADKDEMGRNIYPLEDVYRRWKSDFPTNFTFPDDFVRE